MTVSTKTGATVNQCHIQSELYFDGSVITWQSTSVNMRIRAWFITSTYVTDANNAITFSGSHTGTKTPAMNINYQTGTFLIYDKTVSVALTSSAQTYTVNATLTNVEYSGTLTTGDNSITIPAKPSPVSVATYDKSTVITGQTLTVTTNRQNAAYTHKWYYKNSAGSWVQIASGITTASTTTITTADFAPQMPNSASSVFVFKLETYDGSNALIGSVSKNITVTLVDTVKPTITSVTAVDAITNVNTVVGKFVKLLSKITATVNGAAGVYGSTITKTEIIINDVTYNGSSVTTDFLNFSGDATVQGRVTDSRGRIGTYDLAINVLDYTTPAISSFTVLRCDSSGNLLVTGTYGKSASAGSVASLVNGTEKNTLTYTLSSRVKGTTTWTTQKAATVIAGLTLNITETIGSLGGTFSAVNAYEFMLSVADKFNTTLTLYTMPVSAVTLSLNKSGIGVGKVWGQGAIDAAGDIFATGGLSVGGAATVGGTLGVTGAISEGGSTLASKYSSIGNTGLRPVIPTSISFSGTSASVSGTGIIFNGITSLYVNGVYSSLYDHYCIMFYAKDTGGTDGSGFSYRHCSADNTEVATTNYSVRGFTAGTSLTVDTSYTNAMLAGVQSSVGVFAEMVVMGPNTTECTVTHLRTIKYPTVTAYYQTTLIDVGTRMTGFRFFMPTAGTVAGKIHVYGYSKG